MSFSNLRMFGEEVASAIENDYLLVILITSHTSSPKNPSTNLPFGLGKTTLAMWFNYGFNDEDWDKAFSVMAYNPIAYTKFLLPNPHAEHRKRCAQWDDVQLTAPAEKAVPKAISSLASYITGTRPEVALHIWTAPNINSIAAPLRRLVTHEVIVYDRGKFEVQKVTYHKNVKDPKNDICKLTYLEQGTFPPLPADIQQRYNEWRAREKKKLFSRLLKDLESYVRISESEQPEGQNAVELEGVVKKYGSNYVVTLGKELGERLYNKEVVVSGRY